MYITMNRFKVAVGSEQDFRAFEDWTKSEAFRASHRNGGDNRPLYLGHPEFEGFAVIQTVAREPVTS